MIDPAELMSRQRRSQRSFYRSISRGSPGAELLELPGVQATLIPVREWFSIFNSVLYARPSDLERAHDALAAAYDAAGVKAWTVWVPPGDRTAAVALERRGHVLDSTPMLFGASLDSLDLKAQLEFELQPKPTWRLVAEINDRAHGVLEPWSMAAVFQTMCDPASQLYVARHDNAPACALIAHEHESDCYFWFVATVPEARGAGLASELMRHALRQARARPRDDHAGVHEHGRADVRQTRLPAAWTLRDVGAPDKLTELGVSHGALKTTRRLRGALSAPHDDARCNEQPRNRPVERAKQAAASEGPAYAPRIGDLDDRTFLVTGANTGIGRETVLALAGRGARVFVASRSEAKTLPVIDEIAAQTGNGALTFLSLDLGDLASVRACANEFLRTRAPLHGLINNAGLAGQRGMTESGFELAFGTNYVGPFLLTGLLLGRLRESAPARIVNVSSIGHYRAAGIDYEAVRQRTKSVTGLPEYAVSKLGNVLHAQELAWRLEGDGVTTYSLHPGAIASDVWRRVPWPVRPLIKRKMQSPAEGARTTLYCATSPEVADDSGHYYDDCRRKEPSAVATPQLAGELWDRSTAWVGLET